MSLIGWRQAPQPTTITPAMFASGLPGRIGICSPSALDQYDTRSPQAPGVSVARLMDLRAESLEFSQPRDRSSILS